MLFYVFLQYFFYNLGEVFHFELVLFLGDVIDGVVGGEGYFVFDAHVDLQTLVPISSKNGEWFYVCLCERAYNGMISTCLTAPSDFGSA